MSTSINTAFGPHPRVLVVGAGVGGLTAAAWLAGAGCEVQLLERAAKPGGKLREVAVDGSRLDAGPTVLTMRWIFDELFAELGAPPDGVPRMQPATVLARHAWSADEWLDLPADLQAAADAIGRFSGAAEAHRYLAFCRRAQRVYAALERPYLRASRPSLPALLWRGGLRGLPGLARIAPFATLWNVLGRQFDDPRLQQLFGRYATYCGSSPFLAPATLMLVAHVEREGVWLLEGGMQRLAEALAAVAQRQGVRLRCGVQVEEILARGGRASGVRLAGGEQLQADAVVFNGDVAALAGGLLGTAAQRGWGKPPARSLSALTWHVRADSHGPELHRHNVFFGADYRAEFDAIAAGRLPPDPTVYLCAQDRPRPPGADAAGPERLMALVNAPAKPLGAEEIAACHHASFLRLQRAGLQLVRRSPTLTTTPEDFAALFPGTAGALYGRPTHGWQASFRRPGATSPLPGLFLAGGSVHPGPGLPMAALSGRQAAVALLRSWASTHRWHPVATPGGTSTR